MNPMKWIKVVVLSLTLSCLMGFEGCAQLGITSAPTFNEDLAIAYTSVTTIRQTATQLLNAKKLTAADGQNVLAQTDNARSGLDIARTLSSTNLASATGKLTAIKTVLSALTTYLATRQAGG